MNTLEPLEPRLCLSRSAATAFTPSLQPPSLVVNASPSPISAPSSLVSPAADLTLSVTGTASDGKLSAPYRFFIPQLAAPAQTVPLIVYLHGLGDGGTDNVAQTYWMSNLRANTAAGQYPAYILALQLPLGMQWYGTGKQPSRPEALLMALIKNILPNQPNIDPTRIYLTGVSAGALGVWDLLHRNPRFFAAGVPMSGALGASLAPSLAHIPIWAFHGAADTGVSPIYTRQLIAAIVKAGGTPWYTEVPDGGHFIWDAVYAQPSLYAWMFSQHLAHAPK